MDTRVFCVYNLARGVFLSSKVTAVDGVNEPLKILKVLVNGLGLDKESGLWISSLSAIPAVPRLFPFDLLYLDRDQRVIESVEVVPGAEFPPYRGEVAAALVLARRTLESTETRHGDRLIIAVEAEIDGQIAAANESDAQPIGAKSRSSNGRFPGRFDKNGKEQGTAVSAVLTEPFPPVVTRPAEGGAFGQAVAAIEPESGIRDSSAPETKGIKKPVQVTDFNLTGQDSFEQAKAAIAGERPDISTSEPIVERRRSTDHPVINGQKGGVEDLFSNWVDAPTPSSAWIARNPRPEVAPAVPPAPGVVGSSLPDRNPPGPEPAPKESDAVQAKAALAPANAVPKTISAGPEPNQVNQPQRGGAPAQAAPAPTRTIVPQSPTTTTFTAGNLGEWRVSMPTAVGPVATVRSSGQTRPSAPVADRESTSVKETNTEVKAAPDATAKVSDSPAAPLATSGRSRVADLPLESIGSRTAAKVRGAVEAPPSKLGKDKTVPPADISREGIADGTAARAHSQSAAPDLPDNSKLAASSVAANSEKKPVIDVSSDPRARLLVNLAEKVKSPLIAAAVSAVREKVQTQPVAPTAKVDVVEQSAPAASKAGKVASRAVVPAKKGAPKASPQAPMGRTEANGKSQTGPLSLGTRFKRWLNPAPPVATDRRRAHRRYVPGMVAHYYTGGAPKPHDVADISMTGFYLLTEDRWMPETMIQMILQKPCAKGERKQSISVLSRIVRRGSDGVAVEFVMPEGLNPMSHDIQPSQATDKFTLARFL